MILEKAKNHILKQNKEGSHYRFPPGDSVKDNVLNVY